MLSRRWVVERFLTWINRNRRFAKDFEGSIPSENAFSLCRLRHAVDPRLIELLLLLTWISHTRQVHRGCESQSPSGDFMREYRAF